jgi:hypothetical protein
MGRIFSSGRGGVRVGLDLAERALLGGLLEEVDRLLDDGREPAPKDPLEWMEALSASMAAPQPGVESEQAPARPPDDPALARLLPDGARDDPATAAEFRRLTEPDVRARKREALSLAVAALGRQEPVVLSREEAGALLKGLTDVRLVLAERLGLRTDEDAERLHLVLAGADPREDDPWLAAAALYDVLTWWQESLVAALGR